MHEKKCFKRNKSLESTWVISVNCSGLCHQTSQTLTSHSLYKTDGELRGTMKTLTLKTHMKFSKGRVGFLL